METVPASETIVYRDGVTSLHGLLVRPPASTAPRPPIVLLHGGAGLDEHARTQAHRYATRGHTVLAADLYGPDVAGDRDRVMATIRRLRSEPGLLAGRVATAVDTSVDALSTALETLTVIGYCFGGTAALELARAGSTVAGVVSVHGGLAASRRASAGEVRTRVLVCHGGADPHVPPDELTAFVAEMTASGADWQLIVHGHAKHGFTHAHDRGDVPGVAYDPEADRRSYAAICSALDESAAARDQDDGA